MLSQRELPNLPVPGDVGRRRGRAVPGGGEPKVQERGGPSRYVWQRVLQMKTALYLFFF